jgi:hypothetical protein
MKRETKAAIGANLGWISIWAWLVMTVMFTMAQLQMSEWGIYLIPIMITSSMCFLWGGLHEPRRSGNARIQFAAAAFNVAAIVWLLL